MAERLNLALNFRTDPPVQDSSDRTAAEIRESIAARRKSITETVDKLGDRLQQTFDWREYVAEYPAVALGLAAGGGIILSAFFKREPTPQERIMDALAELTEDLTMRISDAAGDLITPRLISQRAVKAAATTMLAKAAIAFAKRKIGEAIDREREGPLNIPGRTSEALSKL